MESINVSTIKNFKIQTLQTIKDKRSLDIDKVSTFEKVIKKINEGDNCKTLLESNYSECIELFKNAGFIQKTLTRSALKLLCYEYMIQKWRNLGQIRSITSFDKKEFLAYLKEEYGVTSVHYYFNSCWNEAEGIFRATINNFKSQFHLLEAKAMEDKNSLYGLSEHLFSDVGIDDIRQRLGNNMSDQDKDFLSDFRCRLAKSLYNKKLDGFLDVTLNQQTQQYELSNISDAVEKLLKGMFNSYELPKFKHDIEGLLYYIKEHVMPQITIFRISDMNIEEFENGSWFSNQPHIIGILKVTKNSGLDDAYYEVYGGKIHKLNLVQPIKKNEGTDISIFDLSKSSKESVIAKNFKLIYDEFSRIISNDSSSSPITNQILSIAFRMQKGQVYDKIKEIMQDYIDLKKSVAFNGKGSTPLESIMDMYISMEEEIAPKQFLGN